MTRKAVSKHTEPEREPLLILQAREQDGDAEFWRENCSPVCDITPIHSEANSGLFRTETWYADRCIFTQTTYDAKALKHGKHQSENVGHVLLLSRFMKGSSRGARNGVPFEHVPGGIAITPYTRSFDSVHEASIVQSVYIPLEAVGLTAAQFDEIRSFSPGSSRARLLNKAMDRVFEPLLRGVVTIPARAVEGILASFNLAIGAPIERLDVRAQAREAMAEMIFEYVEQNLASPDLSASSILKDFGVSRASLYRIFEARGGVAHYIKERRLFRAVFEISKQPNTRGQIHRVAEKLAYSSDANFNRAVRRAFGVSPGALFESPLESLVMPKYTPGFRNFIEQAGIVTDRKPRAMLAA